MILLLVHSGYISQVKGIYIYNKNINKYLFNKDSITQIVFLKNRGNLTLRTTTYMYYLDPHNPR